MQALWLENNQLQLRHDIPIPQPPPAEALVRVVPAGICNTDLELIGDYYPYNGILGHLSLVRVFRINTRRVKSSANWMVRR